MDGTLVPTRDHKVATQSKNYRYSTNHQVVIDADTELVVALGRPLPGNRNDCRGWTESGAADACCNTVVIADGGYPSTGLIIPRRRSPGVELPEWKQAHNKSHRRVRARVKHAFARMKTWKILRDCRLRGDGVGCRDSRGGEAGQPRPRLLIPGRGPAPSPRQTYGTSLSYTLLILDGNVRAASLLGIVGAGGIGMELTQQLRLFEYGTSVPLSWSYSLWW